MAERIEAMTLSTLLAGHAAVDRGADREIGGLALDSRAVREGDCFIALKGHAQDGARYARDAVAAGAVAVLHEAGTGLPALGVPVIGVGGLRAATGVIAARFFGHPSAALDVVAITGTNGKTTVAWICAQALAHLRGDCGYLGTLGCGTPGTLAPATITTPDPIALQRELASLRARGITAAAIEASSHALDQDRLSGVAVDVAVFTGLGHDHLDYHGSLAAYAAAKRRLFDLPGLAHVVLNGEDPQSAALAARCAPDCAVWSYVRDGAPPPPGTRHALALEHVTLRVDGSTLSIRTPAGRARLESPLVGDFNAQNVCAALAALLALAVPLADACAALGAARPAPGRMELFGGGTSPTVFVDYAHSPDSLERVLAMLRRLAPRRVVCVFGCGGDRDHSKRPLMGGIAERLADLVILTADNPRSEDNAAIVAEIRAGMRAPDAAVCDHDRARAIATAIGGAGPDDVVLVAGKGHEATQTIGGVTRPFSDQTVVREALARWRRA